MKFQKTALFVCIALATGTPAFGAPDLYRPIFVDSRDVLEAGGQKVCLVELVDRTAADRLEKVTVTAYQSSKVILQTAPRTLLPGQALTVQQRIDAASSCSAQDVFFRLRFNRRNTYNDMLLARSAATESPSAASGPFQAQLLTATVTNIISLLAVIIGAWLGHYLTGSREREKDKNAHRLKRFEAAEPAIRKFLTEWKASPIVTELDTYFDDLGRAMIVDRQLVDAYHKTRNVLADPKNDQIEKRAAAAALSLRFAEYIERLDPGH